MKTPRELCQQIVKKYENNIPINLMIKNYRFSNIGDVEVFRFTMGIMSQSFIDLLKSDKNIKDVYYNPAFTPPGGSIDSISLRYKVYVLFN